MIISNQIFTAQCDRCDTFFVIPGTDNAEGFESPQAAEKQLKQDGWTFEGNECYCPKCMAAIREERRKRRENEQ